MIQYCGLVNSILNNAGFVVVIPGMQRGTTLKTKQSYQKQKLVFVIVSFSHVLILPIKYKVVIMDIFIA